MDNLTQKDVDDMMNLITGKDNRERVWPEINDEIEQAINEGIEQGNREGLTEEEITAIVASHPEGIAPDGVNEREWLERALRDMPAFLKTFEEGLKEGLYDDLLKEYGYKKE
jgi:hypothetical protein